MALASSETPLGPLERALDAMFDGLAEVYELDVARETLVEIRRLYAAAGGR